MISSYVRVFLQLLKKHWSYYVINVGGLSVGITSFILIMAYSLFELSHDNFIDKSDRIFRVVWGSARTPIPLASAIDHEIAGVDKSTRMIYSHFGMVVVDSTGNSYEEKGYSVDSTFLDIFNFGFIHGSSASLNDPKSVVVTEKFANKIFGTTDVLGRVIKIESSNDDPFHRIDAVIRDLPINSQFDFDILTRYLPHSSVQNWEQNLVYTYVLLEDHSDAAAIQSEIRQLFARHSGGETEVNELELQTFRDQHFDNTRRFDFVSHANKQNIYVLISIGALIFLIACINFVNLSTAKALDRNKEVGIRKIVGATRRQLVLQFLCESMLVTVFSYGLAMAMVSSLAPWFEVVTSVDLYQAVESIGILVIIMIVTTPFIAAMAAGLYPSFVMTSLKPVKSIGGHGKYDVRKTLVTIQFAIASFLIVGTLTIVRQFNFMNSKDLGFDQEQTLILNVGFPGVGGKLEQIRTELMKKPGIVSVSGALTVPGDLTYTMPYSIRTDLSNDDDRLSLAGLYVDPEFVKNVDIQLIGGRGFSGNTASDTLSFLMNETAVTMMVEKYGGDWKDPVGKSLNYFRSNTTGFHLAKAGTVIGVVKDFNFYSLHRAIEPLAIQVDYKLLYKLVVKVSPSQTGPAIDHIQTVWRSAGISKPFNYTFLDDHFGRAYDKEEKFRRIFLTFSIVSILISACGLYGLVLYTTERRTKEISIRKVLGADSTSIVALVTRDFYFLVLIAVAFSTPLAWWSMKVWLGQFAYRTDLNWEIFVLSVMACLAITSVTVLFRVVTVLGYNPVQTLKSE